MLVDSANKITKKLLILIVRNEISNLDKIARNILNGGFDMVVVTDTGSTDGTDIALEKLGCIVYREKWVNFSHNRNSSTLNGIKEIHKYYGLQYGPLNSNQLKLIRSDNWFIFNIDADDEFVWSGEIDPNVSIVLAVTRFANQTYNKIVGFKWNTFDRLVWRGELHEIWVSNRSSKHVNWISLNASCSGFRSSDPNKFINDSHNMLMMINSGRVPKCEIDRYYFYLGRSQYIAQYFSSCVHSMTKVLNSNISNDHKYCALLEIAAAYDNKNNSDYNHDKSTQYMMKAYELMPSRPEALSYLFYEHYNNKRYGHAASLGLIGLKMYPNSLNKGHLFYVKHGWKFFADLSFCLSLLSLKKDYCEVISMMETCDDYDNNAKMRMKTNIELRNKWINEI